MLQTRIAVRFKTLLAFVLVVAGFGAPSICWGQPGQPVSPSIEQRFQEIDVLRSRTQFDEAFDALRGLINEFAAADSVLRRAYNQLVYTLVAQSQYLKDEESLAADAGDQKKVTELRARQRDLTNRFSEVVREALHKFPDLVATDDVPDADLLNKTYEPTRQSMFGGLVVESRPDSAAVWISSGDKNWKHMGWTPLRRNLYPIGSYELKVTKTGYGDRTRDIQIQPSLITPTDFPLQRHRGKTWWLTRVVGPVATAAAVVTYALVNGGSGSSPEPEPLPGPPAPPSR
jgi:hypothetical protein